MSQDSSAGSKSGTFDPMSLDHQVVVLEPASPMIHRVLEPLLKDRHTRVHRVASQADLLKTVLQTSPCLVLLSGSSKQEIIQCTVFLKNASTLIRKEQVKTMIISSIDDRRLVTTFSKMGCSEFIIDSISDYSFFFKIGLHLKALRAKRQQKIKEFQLIQAREKRGASNANTTVVKGGMARTESLPPVALKEDLWIFRGERPRKSGLQWSAEVEGPDPNSGEWVPVGQDKNGQKRWLWKSKGEDGKDLPPGSVKEGWVFTGQKPTFQGASGKWRMSGPKPSLTYKRGANDLASKFGLSDDDTMQIAQDSPQALRNIAKSRQIATLAKELRQASLKSAQQAGPKAGSRPMDLPTLDSEDDEENDTNADESGESGELVLPDMSDDEDPSTSSSVARKKALDGIRNDSQDEDLARGGGKKPSASEAATKKKNERPLRGGVEDLPDPESDPEEVEEANPFESLDEESASSSSAGRKKPGGKSKSPAAADSKGFRNPLFEMLANSDSEEIRESLDELADDELPDGMDEGSSSDPNRKSRKKLQASSARDLSHEPKSEDKPLTDIDPDQLAESASAKADEGNAPKSPPGKQRAPGKASSKLPDSLERSDSLDPAPTHENDDPFASLEESDGSSAGRKSSAKSKPRVRKRKGRRNDLDAKIDLQELQADTFGPVPGTWEQVPGQGMIFITPDMKAASPETISEKTPFWYVQNPNLPKPYYDGTQGSWFFEGEIPPDTALFFDSLPHAFQEFLRKMVARSQPLGEAIQETLRELENQAKRTQEAFQEIEPESLNMPELTEGEAIDPEAEKFLARRRQRRLNKAGPGATEAVVKKPEKKPGATTGEATGIMYGPLSTIGFFLALTDRIGGRNSVEEVRKWLAEELSKRLNTRHVTIARMPVGQPRYAVVAATTCPKYAIGQTIDLNADPSMSAAFRMKTTQTEMAQGRAVCIQPIRSRGQTTEGPAAGLLILERPTGHQPFSRLEISFLQQISAEIGSLLKEDDSVRPVKKAG